MVCLSGIPQMLAEICGVDEWRYGLMFNEKIDERLRIGSRIVMLHSK